MSPGGNGAPPSPGPYLASPGLGAAMYPPYGQSYSMSGNGGGPGSDTSPEDTNAWSNRYVILSFFSLCMGLITTMNLTIRFAKEARKIFIHSLHSCMEMLD